MNKTRFSTGLLTMVIAVGLIMGPAFTFDAFAKGSRSSSRSYSSKSSSKSSYGSKSSAIRTTTSTKSKKSSTSFFGKKSSKAVAAPKTKDVWKSGGSKRGGKKSFAGTSRFDARQGKAIRTQKAVASKTALAKENGKYAVKPPLRKPVKPVVVQRTVYKTQTFSGYRANSTWGYSDHRNYKRGYYNRHGWDTPDYIYRSQPSFGMLDGMALGYLLGNMGNNGNAEMMREMKQQHSEDYKQWRAEMDRLAAGGNTEVAANLKAMDTNLAGRSGPIDTAAITAAGLGAGIMLSGETLAAMPTDKPVLRIATGPNKDSNYVYAGFLLNKAVPSVDVQSITSVGSGQSLDMFIAGKVDAMIVQHDAVDQKASAHRELIKKIKSHWVPLYKEPVQFLVNRADKLKDLTDLTSKNVFYAGPLNSGSDLSTRRIKRSNPAYSGIKIINTSYDEAYEAVKHVRGAVMVYVAGLKSATMAKYDAQSKKDSVMLLQVKDPKVYATTDYDGYPLYAPFKVPKGSHKNLQKGWMFQRKVVTPATTCAIVISDAWIKKYGESALTDLTAGIMEVQPAMFKKVGDI